MYKCPPIIQHTKPTTEYTRYAAQVDQNAQRVVDAPNLLKVAFGKPLREFAQMTKRCILPTPTTDLVQTINTKFKDHYLPYEITQHDQESFSEVDHNNLVGVVIVVNKPINPPIHLEVQTTTQQQRNPIWVYVHYTVAATLGDLFKSVGCVVYSLKAPSKPLCEESRKPSCSGNYVHEMYTGTTGIHSVYPYLEPNLCAFLELMRSATLKSWGCDLSVPKTVRQAFDLKHFWHPAIELNMVPDGSLLVVNGFAHSVMINANEQRTWAQLSDKRDNIPEYYSGVWFESQDHITAKRDLFEHNELLNYGTDRGLEMARLVTVWVRLCTPGLAGGAIEENRLQGGTVDDVVTYLENFKKKKIIPTSCRAAITKAILSLKSEEGDAASVLRTLYAQLRICLKGKATDLIDQIQTNLEKIPKTPQVVDSNTHGPTIGATRVGPNPEDEANVGATRDVTNPESQAIVDTRCKARRENKLARACTILMSGSIISLLLALVLLMSVDWACPAQDFVNYASNKTCDATQTGFIKTNFPYLCEVYTALPKYVFPKYEPITSDLLENSTSNMSAFDFERFNTSSLDDLVLCLKGSCSTTSTFLQPYSSPSSLEVFYGSFAKWEHRQPLLVYAYISKLKVAVTVHGILNNVVDPEANRLFVGVFLNSTGCNLKDTLDVWMGQLKFCIDNNYDVDKLASFLDQSAYGNLVHEWLLDLAKHECQPDQLSVMDAWHQSWSTVFTQRYISAYPVDLRAFENDTNVTSMVKTMTTPIVDNIPASEFGTNRLENATFIRDHPYLTYVGYMLRMDAVMQTKEYNSSMHDDPNHVNTIIEDESDMVQKVHNFATRVYDYVNKTQPGKVDELAKLLSSIDGGPRIHEFMKKLSSSKLPQLHSNHFFDASRTTSTCQALRKYWAKLWEQSGETLTDRVTQDTVLHADYAHKVSEIESALKGADSSVQDAEHKVDEVWVSYEPLFNEAKRVNAFNDSLSETVKANLRETNYTYDQAKLAYGQASYALKQAKHNIETAHSIPQSEAEPDEKHVKLVKVSATNASAFAQESIEASIRTLAQIANFTKAVQALEQEVERLANQTRAEHELAEQQAEQQAEQLAKELAKQKRIAYKTELAQIKTATSVLYNTTRHTVTYATEPPYRGYGDTNPYSFDHTTDHKALRKTGEDIVRWMTKQQQDPKMKQEAYDVTPESIHGILSFHAFANYSTYATSLKNMTPYLNASAEAVLMGISQDDVAWEIYRNLEGLNNGIVLTWFGNLLKKDFNSLANHAQIAKTMLRTWNETMYPKINASLGGEREKHWTDSVLGPSDMVALFKPGGFSTTSVTKFVNTSFTDFGFVEHLNVDENQTQHIRESLILMHNETVANPILRSRLATIVELLLIQVICVKWDDLVVSGDDSSSTIGKTLFAVRNGTSVDNASVLDESIAAIKQQGMLSAFVDTLGAQKSIALVVTDDEPLLECKHNRTMCYDLSSWVTNVVMIVGSTGVTSPDNTLELEIRQLANLTKTPSLTGGMRTDLFWKVGLGLATVVGVFVCWPSYWPSEVDLGSYESFERGIQIDKYNYDEVFAQTHDALTQSGASVMLDGVELEPKLLTMEFDPKDSKKTKGVKIQIALHQALAKKPFLSNFFANAQNSLGDISLPSFSDVSEWVRWSSPWVRKEFNTNQKPDDLKIKKALEESSKDITKPNEAKAQSFLTTAFGEDITGYNNLSFWVFWITLMASINSAFAGGVISYFLSSFLIRAKSKRFEITAVAYTGFGIFLALVVSALVGRTTTYLGDDPMFTAAWKPPLPETVQNLEDAGESFANGIDNMINNMCNDFTSSWHSWFGKPREEQQTQEPLKPATSQHYDISTVLFGVKSAFEILTTWQCIFYDTGMKGAIAHPYATAIAAGMTKVIQAFQYVSKYIAAMKWTLMLTSGLLAVVCGTAYVASRQNESLQGNFDVSGLVSSIASMITVFKSPAARQIMISSVSNEPVLRAFDAMYRPETLTVLDLHFVPFVVSARALLLRHSNRQQEIYSQICLLPGTKQAKVQNKLDCTNYLSYMQCTEGKEVIDKNRAIFKLQKDNHQHYALATLDNTTYYLNWIVESTDKTWHLSKYRTNCKELGKPNLGVNVECLLEVAPPTDGTASVVWKTVPNKAAYLHPMLP